MWSMHGIQPLRIMCLQWHVNCNCASPLAPVTKQFGCGICEGSLLASGSADCTVKLWDATTTTKAARRTEERFRVLKTLPTKFTPVYTSRFSRRNLLFAAGALAKRLAQSVNPKTPAPKSKNSTDSGTISWKKQLGFGNHPCIFPPWNFFVSHQSEKEADKLFPGIVIISGTEKTIFEGFRSRCMQGPGENSSPPLYLLRNSHDDNSRIAMHASGTQLMSAFLEMSAYEQGVLGRDWK
ncbi:hypothetical protein OIU76_027535 [Salix suchowensis]|nr:hypothetical protein OIU76_027535 [Salix suchowensis]